jgi:hypothetical protein
MRTFASIALAGVTALTPAACGGAGENGNGGDDTYIARLGETGIDTTDRVALLEVGNETCDKQSSVSTFNVAPIG